VSLWQDSWNCGKCGKNCGSGKVWTCECLLV
jgi:hypothetical protein